MQKNLTPRYGIIAIILIWAIWSLSHTWKYHSMNDEEREVLRESGKLQHIESKIIRQGLDLKGGMYIVLEADIPKLISNLSDIDDERLNSIIKKSEQDSKKNQTDFFVAFKNNVKENDFKLSRYYYQYGSSFDEIMLKLEEEANDAIDRVLEILQNRVDQFGVSEPTIQKQGNHRIVVELAGIQDSDRARSLLQSTALLEFYLIKNPTITNEIINQVDNILSKKLLQTDSSKPSQEKTPKLADTEPDSNKAKETKTVSDLFGDESNIENGDTSENEVNNKLPFSSLLVSFQGDMGVKENNIYSLKKLINTPEVQTKLANSNGQFLFSQEAEDLVSEGSGDKFFRLYYLEKSPELTGGVVEEAKADIGSIGGGSSGQPVVSLTMNSDGSRSWARITGANVGERIAIVLDNKVHMAPSIREKIPGGRTQIEGFADINEAKDIAIILRAGALPTPVEVIEERVVGPSLGADSISKGTRAVLFGLASVLIFMLVYYKLAGLIANFALVWNILLVLAVLASLQATLTLPGIAGLILTVGMSIDANVIIFERVREELRKGKTAKSAIESGYNRAITTIIDANVTTLIASLVLYQFGTGPIKGFATVLFWGILISMFTAVYITKTIFSAYTSRRGTTKLSI